MCSALWPTRCGARSWKLSATAHARREISCGAFELSRPAVSEHLAVLRSAGLVREEPRGRYRYYHLEAAPLAEAVEWLHPFERYWRARMGALSDLIDEENR